MGQVQARSGMLPPGGGEFICVGGVGKARKTIIGLEGDIRFMRKDICWVQWEE